MTTPTNSGDSLAGAVRDLASQLNQDPLPYTPPQIVKGVITSTSLGTTPPTVSLTLSGDTAITDGVRFLESYSPTVGDTVAIAKTGPDIFIMGCYANGASNWTQPTLSTGFTHNGDSQGNVQWRLVWDNGSLKMQWQGCAARSANTTMISAANGPTTHPTAKRKLSCTRGMGNGNATPNAVIVFNTDGSVVLDGVAYSLTTAGHTHAMGTSDGQLFGYLSQAGSDLGHYHGLGTSAGATDSVTLPAPDWVSFHGIEYFL